MLLISKDSKLYYITIEYNRFENLKMLKLKKDREDNKKRHQFWACVTTVLFQWKLGNK